MSLNVHMVNFAITMHNRVDRSALVYIQTLLSAFARFTALSVSLDCNAASSAGEKYSESELLPAESIQFLLKKKLILTCKYGYLLHSRGQENRNKDDT